MKESKEIRDILKKFYVEGAKFEKQMDIMKWDKDTDQALLSIKKVIEGKKKEDICQCQMESYGDVQVFSMCGCKEENYNEAVSDIANLFGG